MWVLPVVVALAGTLFPASGVDPTVRTASIRATVNSPGTPLNVRTGPGTSFDIMTTAPHGTNLVVSCQVSGQYIIGSVSRTARWDRLSNGRYVSDAYVAWSPARPANLKTCGQAPPTGPPGVPSTQAAFIAGAVEPAKASAREFRVPASVTIAQAILESGWGDSQLTRDDHNYFGIKCFGTPGPIAVGCHTYDTHECDSDGSCYPTKASFRVYRDATDSFRDHGRFLVVNERYKSAFAFSNEPARFAVEIHRAGYATSPTYADNLIGLMRQYDLYRYDIVLP